MSVEAEMSVIGCMILDGECAKQAVDGLATEMFCNTKTKRIFSAAQELYWENKPVDVVTLVDKLPDDKVDIVRLAEFVPSTANFPQYMRIVWEDWRQRMILQAAEDVYTGALNRTAEESVELLRQIVKKQEAVAKAEQEEGKSFLDAAEELLKWLQDTFLSDSVKSGYYQLDSMTGGFLRKSVTALCARSGGGKTDYAVNLALGMMRKGYRILYFSMEMPAVQLMQRVASKLLHVDGARIRDRNLTAEELKMLESVLMMVEESGKLYFIEEPRVSLRAVRHYIDLHKPDAVVIDHIGLMERPAMRDQYKALGLVSNGLKQLALEKNIAVLELSQMNRQIESRSVKIPTLADIRESGDIEQDADYILFVQPEDLTQKVLSGNAWADVTLYLLKNRHGRPGKLEYHWQPQYHTFLEVDKAH